MNKRLMTKPELETFRVKALTALGDRDLVARPLNVVSLGAGVQSSTLVLRAARGELISQPKNSAAN